MTNAGTLQLPQYLTRFERHPRGFPKWKAVNQLTTELFHRWRAFPLSKGGQGRGPRRARLRFRGRAWSGPASAGAHSKNLGQNLPLQSFRTRLNNSYSADLLEPYRLRRVLARFAVSRVVAAVLHCPKLGSSSLRISLRVFSSSTPNSIKTRAATLSPSDSNPRRMCSVPT